MAQTYRFGYCTNVHAGTELETAKSNLLKFAGPVRSAVCPGCSLPVGLWLAETAAQDLSQQGASSMFGDWLSNNGFAPYTFNGFPQGDFHQSVVKRRVYQPTWRDRSRLEYTENLANILAALIPAEQIGTISTLPLGWPEQPWQQSDFEAAAANLLTLARRLDQIFQETGREIVVAIEPEPGCVLNTAPEIVQFFDQYLFSGPDEAIARRHLGVCHDICHSGVMFEPQADALAQYLRQEIRIGKVQVSSAVHVPWDDLGETPAAQSEALKQLRGFNEPKYLHQTSRSTDAGHLAELADDLPVALQHWLPDATKFPRAPWRVHFHVPIFVNQFGVLQTTQLDIATATEYLERHRNEQCGGVNWFTGHYEVETYAWPVLPPSLAVKSLAEGISQELQYFETVLDSSTV